MAEEKTDITNEILFLNNKLNEKNIIKGNKSDLYLRKFFIKKYYLSERDRRKRIKKKENINPILLEKK